MSDFSISFLIRLNGTLLSCTPSCAATHQSHFAYPAPVRCTVLRHEPSNLEPIFSLPTGLCLTPISFLDIGSFPLYPETCGGGNTLWMPFNNALEKWRNCAGSLVFSMCIKLTQNTSSMVKNNIPSDRVKKLLQLFVPHILEFYIPISSGIVLPSSGCSGSVPTCL